MLNEGETGNFRFEDITVFNNTNVGSSVSDLTLILVNDFVNGTVIDADFNNNKQGIDLLGIMFGNLEVNKIQFMNNIIGSSIVEIDEIESLNRSTVNIENNTAMNGVIGDSYGFDEYQRANTLIVFDNFTDLYVYDCDVANNEGINLLKEY